MKYLFLMIAFVTMLANLFVTVQAAKLREKIKRVETIKRRDIVTFYLPGKSKLDASDKCEDTMLLDMEVQQ